MDPTAWLGLFTLIILEIVLGIDNLIFIAVLADKLPPSQRERARLIGLSLALVMRLGLLASISWLVTLTEPFVELLGRGISWRDIILILGGLFLLFKATSELHERLAFYQKKLESPKIKSKPEQLRDAQQKVAEKQQRLEQVEALIKKSQLMAPRAGQVSRVMVKVGQAVTSGTEVVSLTDKALAAEIKIPAIEAQGMKVGQDAQLAGSSGALTARVASLRTEGDYALVKYTLPENASA
ncbi:MAG TPA: HlyD family efflux transporter periplasmic adaptor subunit, partial [Cellvibrionaceae bacterium]|nr:HlyD family efflux transporter periplasmic adaptor subunit [Cellvibrionaceae bacterium]